MSVVNLEWVRLGHWKVKKKCPILCTDCCAEVKILTVVSELYAGRQS